MKSTVSLATAKRRLPSIRMDPQVPFTEVANPRKTQAWFLGESLKSLRSNLNMCRKPKHPRGDILSRSGSGLEDCHAVRRAALSEGNSALLRNPKMWEADYCQVSCKQSYNRVRWWHTQPSRSWSVRPYDTGQCEYFEYQALNAYPWTRSHPKCHWLDQLSKA